MGNPANRLLIFLLGLALNFGAKAQLTYEAYYFTTLAGDPNGANGFADGAGRGAQFNFPGRLSVDAQGNIFVADSGNHTIRKITPRGVVTTIAGSPGQLGTNDGTGLNARFNLPFGTAPDGFGNVYVADYGNHLIRKISSDGIVSTVAGVAGAALSVDGTGSSAQFNGPVGILVHSSGDVLVTDYKGNSIRRMSPGGTVTTIAGGVKGVLDGIGLSAQFDGPSGIAEDPSGNLFIVDQLNDTIRKMTPQGEVSTFAGSPKISGRVDGTGTAARFFLPTSLCVDRVGNVFVADNSNRLIRKVTPGGVVTTLGGRPLETGLNDGQGWEALFYGPTGIAADSAGDLYICDYFNHNIRKGSALYISPITPAPALVDGKFTFGFSSRGDSDIVLEASSDFLNWTPIATNAPVEFALFQEALSSTNRFYRLRIERR